MAHSRLNYPFQLPYELASPLACANLSLNQIPYQQPIPNVVALLNLRNTIQAQLLQLQMLNLMNNKMAALAPSLKSYVAGSPDSVSSHSSTEIKPVSTNLNGLPEESEICLEARIKYMLQFFVHSFGRATEKDIQEERQKFAHDERLLKVFDSLIAKYSATTKTREEMIKWIIRRALKSCKQTIKANGKVKPKNLSKDLCKKYFKGKQEKSEDDDEEWVDSLLPFRKNSKNKTMNANFIAEIFGSDEFRGDYRSFLSNFDDTTEKDTLKKVSKFSCFIVECVKKGTIGSIAKYKRVPWLRIWIQNTKKVALELEEGNWDDRSSKKVKSEDNENL